MEEAQFAQMNMVPRKVRTVRTPVMMEQVLPRPVAVLLDTETLIYAVVMTLRARKKVPSAITRPWKSRTL